MVSPVSGNLPNQSVQNTVPLPSSAATEITPPQTASTTSTTPVASTPSSPTTQEQLDDVLRNTGFKGEIDTSDPSRVIVKIVDGVTGRTVVQIPSAAALAFAEALRKGSGVDAPQTSGSLLDEAA